MFQKLLINMIMLCEHRSTEKQTLVECNNGFADRIDLYNSWEKHFFSVDCDDAIIKGEYILNPSGSNKVVILCHGQTATRISTAKYAVPFYNMGYNIVTFDERYHGNSTGKYCTLGWKENDDIKQIISYTKTVFGEEMFWGIQGESMGAASELMLLDTEKPFFVVADCPFADLNILINDLSKKKLKFLAGGAKKGALKIGIDRYNFDYTKVKPINSVKLTNVPICFMHGTGDSLINCNHSQMMYDMCKNNLSEIHYWEGADHAMSMASAKNDYDEVMTTFVRKIEKEYDKN